MKWSACLCALLLAGTAHADDYALVRAGGGLVVGPDLTAWDMGYGTAWDATLDKVGVRLGALAGMLSYPGADATPAFLTLTPDIALYAADEEPTRIYYTLELPVGLLALQPGLHKPDLFPWWLGARLGVELEHHYPSLDLRARVGIFGAAQRNEHGDMKPGVGVRVVIEYGPPIVSGPPRPAETRLCTGRSQ